MDALHTIITIVAGAWAGYLFAFAATLPFGLQKYLTKLRKTGKPFGCTTCMAMWITFGFFLAQHASVPYAFLAGLCGSALGTVLEHHVRITWGDEEDN